MDRFYSKILSKYGISGNHLLNQLLIKKDHLENDIVKKIEPSKSNLEPSLCKMKSFALTKNHSKDASVKSPALMLHNF